MGDIVLREAVMADIDDICRVYTATWKAHYPGIVPQVFLDKLSENHWRHSLRRWLGTGRFAGAVCLDGDDVVAATIFGHARDDTMRDVGEIVSLYVLPAHQRQGIGGRLLDHAKRELKGIGCEHACLWVFEENRKARIFYGQQGFVPSGTQQSVYIGDKRCVDVLMECPL